MIYTRMLSPVGRKWLGQQPEKGDSAPHRLLLLAKPINPGTTGPPQIKNKRPLWVVLPFEMSGDERQELLAHNYND